MTIGLVDKCLLSHSTIAFSIYEMRLQNGWCAENFAEDEIFRLLCVSTLCQPENFIFTTIFSALRIQEARFVNNPG